MSAAVKIDCPYCGTALKCDHARAPGKKVKCPRCGTRFRLPPPPLPVPDPGGGNWQLPVLAAVTLICLVGLGGGIYWLAEKHRATQPGLSPTPAAGSAGVGGAVPVGDSGVGAAGEPPPPSPASPEALQLAQQARAVFEKCCFRCHGENGEAQKGVYILEPDKLVKANQLVPGDPEKSRVYLRMTSDTNPMPPEGKEPRPSADDIALIKQWIAAGAPAVPAPPAAAQGSLDARYLLAAVRDDLATLPELDRPFLRYFTLCHLYNNPEENKKLPVYRAALAKVVNSLSWAYKIVQPRAVDKLGTVYAVDLRDLNWERPALWQQVVNAYPYGLRYDGGADGSLAALTQEIEQQARTPLPHVRADWFVATASRPPLYNFFLDLPQNARLLESRLGVNLANDFSDGKLQRAGFLNSNVSVSKNRMLERHASLFGAYWKSYDFRTQSANRDNLLKFPLGPAPAFLPSHPFPDLAFAQAGGEIIFNLPNGLQGYMLVDANDSRLDAAPTQVVQDQLETAGSSEIVTGLSCMACHVNGMIAGEQVRDIVRNGSVAVGPALLKVQQLYVPPAKMDQLLKEDGDHFVKALTETLKPYQPGTADEPIGAVAKPFLKKPIDLKLAAFELGLADPQKLKDAIASNQKLRDLGLMPLAGGTPIDRATWEQLDGNLSVFQQVARELGLGTPVR